MKANMKVLFAVIAVGLMLMVPFAVPVGLAVADVNNNSADNNSAPNAATQTITGTVKIGNTPISGAQVIVKYTSGQITGEMKGKTSTTGTYTIELKEDVAVYDSIEASVNTTDEFIDGVVNPVHNQQFATMKMTNVKVSDTAITHNFLASTLNVVGTIKTGNSGTQINVVGIQINGAEGQVSTVQDSSGTTCSFGFPGVIGKTYNLSAVVGGVTFTGTITVDSTKTTVVLVPSITTPGNGLLVISCIAPFGNYTTTSESITSIGTNVNFSVDGKAYMSFTYDSAAASISGTFTQNLPGDVKATLNASGATVTTGVLSLSGTMALEANSKIFRGYVATSSGSDGKRIDNYTISSMTTEVTVGTEKQTRTIVTGYSAITGDFYGFYKLGEGETGATNAKVTVSGIGNYKLDKDTIDAGYASATCLAFNNKVTVSFAAGQAEFVKVTADDVYSAATGGKIASGSIIPVSSFYVPVGTLVFVEFGSEFSPSSYKFTAVNTAETIPATVKVLPTTINGRITANGVEIGPYSAASTIDLNGKVCDFNIYVNDKKVDGTFVAKWYDTDGTNTVPPYYTIDITGLIDNGLLTTDKVTVEPVNLSAADTTFVYNIEKNKYNVDLKTGVVETMKVAKGTVSVGTVASFPGSVLPVNGVTVSLGLYTATSSKMVADLGSVESKDGVATFDVALYPLDYYTKNQYGQNLVFVAKATGASVTEYGTLLFSNMVQTNVTVSSPDAMKVRHELPTKDSAGFVIMKDNLAVDATGKEYIASDTLVFCGHYAGGKTLPGITLEFAATLKDEHDHSKVIQTGNAVIKDGMYFIPLNLTVSAAEAEGKLSINLYCQDPFFILNESKVPVKYTVVKPDISTGFGMDVNFQTSGAPVGPVLSIGGASITVSQRAIAELDDITPSAAEIIALLPVILNESFQKMVNTCFWINAGGVPVTESKPIALGTNIVVGVLKTKIAMPLADIALELEQYGDDGKAIAKELMKLSFAHDTNLVIDLKDICIVNEKGEVTHADLNKETKFTMSGPTTIYGKATVGFEKVLDPTPGINPTVLAIGIVAVVIALLAVAFVAFMSVKKNKE